MKIILFLLLILLSFPSINTTREYRRIVRRNLSGILPPGTGNLFEQQEFHARLGMQQDHLNPRVQMTSVLLGYECGAGNVSAGAQIQGTLCLGLSAGELGCGFDAMLRIETVGWIQFQLRHIPFVQTRLFWSAMNAGALPAGALGIMHRLEHWIANQSGVAIQDVDDTKITCRLTYAPVAVGASGALLIGEERNGFRMYGGHLSVRVGLLDIDLLDRAPTSLGSYYIGVNRDQTAALFEITLCGVTIRAVIAHNIYIVQGTLVAIERMTPQLMLMRAMARNARVALVDTPVHCVQALLGISVPVRLLFPR
eukprot:995879_1